MSAGPVRAHRAPSMQTRLILWLGAISLALSAVAGMTLLWALEREMRQQEVTEARGKAELIAHLVGMTPGSHDRHSLDATLDNMRTGHGNLAIWLTDGDQVLYGPAAPRLRALRGDEIEIEAPDGQMLRGVQVPLDAHERPGARLTVAVSTRAGGQFLVAYGSVVALICALWVGATVALAAWAVRRTLAPVGRLSRLAAAIRADQPHERLPVAGIDRELADLVAAFNHTLERLQSAYQQMEGFNADVAHELRTPLATLINGTQVTLASERSPHELRDTLASHLEELENLSSLVNDMLFLARADGGERAAELGLVPIEQEARRVAEFYEADLEDRGLRLRIEGRATAQANARLLRRALANLVANAVRATPAGGEIVIVCTPAPDAAGGVIDITVRNPGTPIPAAELPRLFDRFFRGGPPPAAGPERVPGHGLGLAIVRAIARMHGGTVHARSGDGATEIGLALPAAHITEK